MIDPSHQGPLSQCDDALLADLVEEISQQLEAGGSIDLDSYHRRFPTYADQLRQLVPALDILHRVGDVAINNGASPCDYVSGINMRPYAQAFVLTPVAWQQ